jgi:hypothetical protein
MGIEHDQLVNKVNEKLLDLNRLPSLASQEAEGMKNNPPLARLRFWASVMAQKRRLEILMRRYLDGERTESLFAAMRKEIKNDPAVSNETNAGSIGPAMRKETKE